MKDSKGTIRKLNNGETSLMNKFFAGAHQCDVFCIECGDRDRLTVEMRQKEISDFWRRAVLDYIWDTCTQNGLFSNYRDIKFTDPYFPCMLGRRRGDFRFTRCSDGARFSLSYNGSRWKLRKVLKRKRLKA